MRSLLLLALAASTGVACLPGGSGEDQRPPPVKAGVFREWARAGAKNWNFWSCGGLALRTEAAGEIPPHVPGFRFDGFAPPPTTLLPDPGEPFGLMLTRKELSVTALKQWVAVVEGQKNFRHLILSSTALTDAMMPDLARLTSLDTLNIGHTNISAKGLRSLPALPGLKALIVAECPKVGDEGLQAIASIKSLRALDAEGIDATDAGVAHLTALGDLIALNLNSNKRVTDFGVAPLGRLSRLQALDIHNIPISDKGLASVGTLTELRRLAFDAGGVGDAGFQHLSQLKQMRWLRVWCNSTVDAPRKPVGDAAMKPLGGMTRLECLFLDGSDVGDVGAAELRDLTRLTWLSLENTRVGDAGVQALSGLGNLTELQLRSTLVTDSGLAHVAKLARLTNLGVARTRVTNAGLAQLSALTNLETLALGGDGITDQGLKHLKQLKKLRFLSLWSPTKITATGAADLQKSIPGLSIVF